MSLPHPNTLGASPQRAIARNNGERTRPLDRCMIAASINRADTSPRAIARRFAAWRPQAATTSGCQSGNRAL